MIIPLMAAELYGVAILGRVMGIVLTADSVSESLVPMFVASMRDATGSYASGFLVLVGARGRSAPPPSRCCRDRAGYSPGASTRTNRVVSGLQTGLHTDGVFAEIGTEARYPRCGDPGAPARRPDTAAPGKRLAADPAMMLESRLLRIPC